MSRRFELFWTAALVFVNVPAGAGTVYWWTESGLIAAAAWALGFGLLYFLLVRVMLRSIVRRTEPPTDDHLG